MYEKLETQIGSHDNLALCGIREYTDQKRRHELNRTTILKILQSNGIPNTFLSSGKITSELCHHTSLL